MVRGIHIPRTVAPKVWDAWTPFKGDSMAALKKIKKKKSSIALTCAQ